MFAYGQFGEGFALSTPDVHALRFDSFVSRRGEDVILHMMRPGGRSAYGEPVYAEVEAAQRAFVKEEGGEEAAPMGARRIGRLRLLLPLWAPVEEGDEIEARGARWRIEAVTRNRARAAAEAVLRGDG